MRLNEPSGMLDVAPLSWDWLYVFYNPRRAKSLFYLITSSLCWNEFQSQVQSGTAKSAGTIEDNGDLFETVLWETW